MTETAKTMHDATMTEELMPSRPGSAPEPAAAANAAPAENPDQQLAALTAQLAETKDAYARALADAENTRRRAAKEREEASKFAVTSFARELLNVADNFARAIETAPKPEARDEAMKLVLTGVEATQRQLNAIFEKFGIKKIEAMGQMFDPNLHRVMTEQPSDAPAGTVLQVLQAGYVIQERLLREALVVVAKNDGPSRVDTTV